MASLVAAAAYTSDVPEEVTAQVTSGDDSDTQTVTSPDGSIEVGVDVSGGTPSYSVTFDGTTYIDSSTLGFDFQNQPTFGASADGTTGVDITVTGTESGTKTENWTPEWGSYDAVSRDYNYLRVGLEETASPGRSGNLEIRVFDDGLGFRFAFDSEFNPGTGNPFVISSENTQFNFAGDYTAWWIRNAFVNPRFEQEYSEDKLSAIPAGPSDSADEYDIGLDQVRKGVHTPLTVKAGENAYLSVHESNLEDYSTMSLAATNDSGGTNFAAELAPKPDGTRVSTTAPNTTPWRTIQVTTSPGELIESQLVPLLAPERDDSVLPTDGDGNPDTSWIVPKKYIGIWWTMIAGNAKWQYKTDDEVRNTNPDDGITDPRKYIHGARTERMKRYMHFASENDIDSVLAEGWNQGWDSYGSGADTEGETLKMGVDDSYPDFDVTEVTNYGSGLSNPVEFTIHNETSGNIPNYEDEILNNDIFQGYEDAGIRSIKNGYVSDPGLFGDNQTTPSHTQHSQLAVDHHRTVIEEAAADRQLLEIHEGIKPTGEVRTYPNVAAREVVKAQEYDGFGALGSNVGQDHHVKLPFTRMLAGPTSYQPGIFDLTFNDGTGGQVQTTRAKQLAMYPNYLGGIQMAADRVEAYINDELEVGEYVPAVSGTLDGLTTADTWRNAIGTNYVEFDPTKHSSGSAVEFTVKNVPSDGTYELHIRYASDDQENAQRVIDAGGPQLTLNVDGSTSKINPGYSDDWDEFAVFSTEVDLTQGSNTVRLELNYTTDSSGNFASGDVAGLTVNAVGVSEVGAGSPVPADYSGLTDGVIANENVESVEEFGYIEDVPASGWDETRVVDAAIGDYVVTARRKGDTWYVGAMTDETSRGIDVTTDFLSSQANGWKMEMYTDAAGTDVGSDPTATHRTESIVSSGDTVLASMGESGGVAMKLTPATSSEASTLPAYAKPSQTITASIDDTTEISSSFIQVTGSNDSSNFVGWSDLEILVDGTSEAIKAARLEPGASDSTVPVSVTLNTPGTYTVTVRDPDEGTKIAEKDVTVEAPRTVAEFTDPDGDDVGPGGYTYPKADAFAENAFNLQRFTIEETSSLYRFTWEVENLNNGFGSGRGFSPHMFALWVSNPNSASGTTTPLDGGSAIGPNVTFGSGWDYRLRVDGFNVDAVDSTGSGLSDADGNPVNPNIAVDSDAGTVTYAISKGAFGGVDIFDLEILPVVGSEDFGGFRNVQETASDYQFGGAKAGAADTAPNIIDMVAPQDTTQSEALAYSADERAQVPFTPVYAAAVGDVSRVGEIDDPSGDDDGWGDIDYPTDGFHADPGSLDLTRLEIYEDSDRYYFGARFAEKVDNPKDKAVGFTRHHLQLYVRDPSQSGATSTSVTNVHAYDSSYPLFEEEGWHNVVFVHPNYQAVQDTGFSQTTGDVNASVVREDTVLFDLPKSSLPNDVPELDLTLHVLPWEDTVDAIYKVESDGNAGSKQFSGAPSNYHHTNIIDMTVPDGEDQSTILDPSGRDSSNNFASYSLPLLSMSDKTNSIREAVAGQGPVTESHFEEVKSAYESDSAVEGTGGLVPDYTDVRELAKEVGN
ncbi:glucodextranase DOMON-like domain-containing protein [Haloarcula litorea]|uniref:glucodextranase DOMON-like domain-containing protein n=1 Tax=Haloarcula litorea TaxID=3032579 RepID=UPI00300FD99E